MGWLNEGHVAQLIKSQRGGSTEKQDNVTSEPKFWVHIPLWTVVGVIIFALKITSELVGCGPYGREACLAPGQALSSSPTASLFLFLSFKTKLK